MSLKHHYEAFSVYVGYLVYCFWHGHWSEFLRPFQIFAPQRSKEWHQTRYGRVGASSSGTVLGISPYAGPEHIWQTLFDPGLDPRLWDFPSTEATEHGTRYEPLAALIYMLLTGNLHYDTGLWINPNHALWEHSSPDGVVFERGGGATTRPCLFQLADGRWVLVHGGLEIKCPLYKLYENVPAQYLAQMQQQARTLGLPWVDFFVYFREGNECALWRVYYSHEWTEWATKRYELFQSMRSREQCAREMPCLAHQMQMLIDTAWDWRAVAQRYRVSVDYLKSHLPNTPVRIERRWRANLATRTMQSFEKRTD